MIWRKKAYRIRSDLDLCRYRGDVSKCETCKQKPQKVRDDWGSEFYVMTMCQLYDHAGQGPRARRRWIAIVALSGLAGFAVARLVVLLV